MEHSIETRQRILQCARRLFNQQGMKSTAALKIAYELGMSPGNLAYHFKSKSEIVLALAKQMNEEAEAAILGLKHPLNPSEVIVRLEMTLRAFWHHRFLFNSSVYLRQLNTASANVVHDIKKHVIEVLSRYLRQTVELGEMRAPREPDEILLIAENMLAVWLQWLLEESISHPLDEKPTEAGLLNCMRHHYSLVHPYVSKSFAEATERDLLKRYKGGRRSRS